MRIKTILLIVVTILLTVIIMQNNQEVTFSILFWNPRFSILILTAVIAVTSLLIGIQIGRPRKAKFDESHPSMDNPTGTKNPPLTDEDREYIK
ncbi:hypothetical protein BDD43_5508 [Mucilaginibacter gracilis]|uniref:Uncharacterized protein n=1 Tax=Mucilaginibacter gracilis TaxID=423350 RepID=A0A495JA17_9SPHI|nr:hypothetical protein [Mucilaginibacter gracilis]RKR85244.1 hypothetical protein BDD43_5508 [Mucilaginibacter gracilis]